MRLISFKPMRKGALGKPWAALPAKAQIGEDGRQLEVNGKKQFTSILSWPDRATADRWSAAVVDLVRRRHPNALLPDGER
jgi:hypothetical protein